MINIEDFRTYCLAKPGTTESFPFDEATLVFKVLDKIFAIANVDHFDRINLKCEPEKALELRERFDAVIPGYHMNKKHWNTVILDPSLKEEWIKNWIDDSYQLVVQSLPKRKRAALESA